MKKHQSSIKTSNSEQEQEGARPEGHTLPPQPPQPPRNKQRSNLSPQHKFPQPHWNQSYAKIKSLPGTATAAASGTRQHPHLTPRTESSQRKPKKKTSKKINTLNQSKAKAFTTDPHPQPLSWTFFTGRGRWGGGRKRWRGNGVRHTGKYIYIYKCSDNGSTVKKGEKTREDGRKLRKGHMEDDPRHGDKPHLGRRCLLDLD